MNRFITLIAFCVSIALTCMAEEINSVIVWMSSGTQVSYLIGDHPVVTFQGDELIITTNQNEARYDFGDVVNFTYANDNSALNDLQTQHKANFTVNGDVVYCYNIEPLSDIQVSSLDGKPLVTAKSDADGNAQFELPSQYNGVFVITTSVANFKLIKK